jgi:hypothetical protein
MSHGSKWKDFFPKRKSNSADKSQLPKPKRKLKMPNFPGIYVCVGAIASLILSGAMYWNYHLIDFQMSTPIVTVRLILQK